MRAKPIKALELIYPMIQLFIKNISPFMIDSNLPANSSVLTVAEHNLKDVSNISSIRWYNMIMIYYRSTSFLGAAA